MRKERQLDERELSRPAMVLAQRFVQRWDLHARQLDDGRYICVREHLNVNHFFAHLRGEITLGTYLLNEQSQARCIVYDADDSRGFSSLRQLSQELMEEDVPSYLEKSRRGGHLWLFFGEAVPGHEARAFGLGLLSEKALEGVELFPKPDRLREGPGSLIRMPFGIHRLS